MLRTGSRLPLWVYGAIAALLVAVLAAAWARADMLSRVGLVIPALFWTAAFIIIALRRRSSGS